MKSNACHRGTRDASLGRDLCGPGESRSVLRWCPSAVGRTAGTSVLRRESNAGV